jgi:hypothetical protein
MRIVVIILVLIVILIIAGTRPDKLSVGPQVGEVWYLNEDTFGCHDLKELQGLAALSGRQDADTVFLSALKSVAAHRCLMFHANWVVYIEQPGVFACGRLIDDPSCYFIPSKLLSRAPNQDARKWGSDLISKEPRYLSNNDLAGAKSAIVQDAVEADRPESAPKWQDYCKNFSEETCARIRKIVEAKITPGYCKPGFALVPTHLSEEQLRICYVMPPLRTPAALAPSPAAPPLPSQNTAVKKAFRDCLITNAKDGTLCASTGEFFNTIGAKLPFIRKTASLRRS